MKNPTKRKLWNSMIRGWSKTKFTRRNYTEDRYGKSTEYSKLKPVSCCAIGAITMDLKIHHREVLKYLQDVGIPGGDVILINDSSRSKGEAKLRLSPLFGVKL